MIMTILVVTYRQLIVFLQNARPLLMAAPAPPQHVNHQPQPLAPQPAEPALPPHQLPPPQPLRRSQRVRRAPQRLTL